MRIKYKWLIFIMVICTFIVSVVPTVLLANAAEPPALVILVNNPPDDLSIVLLSDEDNHEAIVRKVAWEGYYAFYSRDMKSIGNYTFKVSTKEESFECTLEVPTRIVTYPFTIM